MAARSKVAKLVGPRSATAPPHAFDEQDWASLERDHRRKLVQAVFVEAGAVFQRLDRRARYDDLLFTLAPLVGQRRMRVRIASTACTPADADAIADLARRQELADHLLIGFPGDDPELDLDDHYLSAGELIELVEASALVTWVDNVPQPDRESFGDARAADGDRTLADTFGLRLLAPLSRNKMPWAMRVAGTAGMPDDWFERVAFRVLTAACGLHGRRFGSAERGKRVADGLLRRCGETDAVLYDCKAAREGYTMTADHERRLIEYAKQPAEHGGDTLRVTRVVIVSSSFPSDAAHHPFLTRREAFRSAGFDLAYVRAVDLAAAAAALRPRLDADTSTAQRVDWCAALDEGLVTRAALLAAVEAA